MTNRYMLTWLCAMVTRLMCKVISTNYRPETKYLEVYNTLIHFINCIIHIYIIISMSWNSMTAENRNKDYSTFMLWLKNVKYA